MGIRFSRGFTIIEVSLFLAISGLLFAALILGVSNTITQQRYRENVVDFAAYLQNQYSETSNIRNIRNGEEQCQNGIINQNATESRGTSDCVILGRAIQIDGDNVSSSSVLGVEVGDYDINNDIQAIKDFGPHLSNFASSNLVLDWQNTIRTAGNNRSTASILILRSPASGLIRVFAWDSPIPDDLAQMIDNSTAASSVLELCVDGYTGSLPTQSVSIDPTISSVDGVIINGDDNGCA